MSDTFDHEGDAWESLDWAIDEEGYYGEKCKSNKYDRRTSRAPRVLDPLHYHQQISFLSLLPGTEKALRVELLPGVCYWIPKSVVRRLNMSNKTMMVHTITYTAILQRGPISHIAEDPGVAELAIRNRLGR